MVASRWLKLVCPLSFYMMRFAHLFGTHVALTDVSW
jgi:hypothetical protein